VTPLSLGIETLGGVCTKLIEKNTTIPTRKSEIFSTAADSQTSVEIRVLQGERPMAEGNRTLGVFHLVGIPAAPRGVPQIEVTFDIDANGIVNVSAKDMGTGKEQKITITSSSGLSKDEIDNMVNEAEAHAEEDKAKQEAVELKNRADTLIYSTEKTLKEHREKVGEADAKNIEDAVAQLKTAVESDDKAAIEQGIEQLTTASHKLAEIMYQQASTEGQAAPGPEAGAGAPAEEDVIDAEFEDMDEKKTD
jgi:molecular chaperone DnaK